MSKKLVFKIATSIVLLVLLGALTKFHPSVGASFAVAQLQDSYISSTGVKFWNTFKNSWLFLYVIFVLLLFYKELKLLIKKIISI